MTSTHIVPHSRGPWALQHALEKTGQSGEVLVFPDDLSFGPIAGDIALTRTTLKTDFGDVAAKGNAIAAFWRRLEQENEPIIVWFGRHSAEELAMLLALCDRLEGRDISVVDVTDLSIRASWNGASPFVPPPRGLLEVPGSVLRSLVGKQVRLDPALRREYAARWQVLQAENAPHRVVGESGLRSTEGAEFDSCLAEALSNEWRRTGWVIHAAQDFACRQYSQVGRFGLLTRAAALVEQGVIEAQGDVWNPWGDDASALRLSNAFQNPAKKGENLHVTSNPSFGGFLIRTLRRAGRDEDVVGFLDDLSAGPIASDDVHVRTAWWDNIVNWPEYGEAISEFWRNVSAGLPLVVWFGRGDARDLSLYLALCERMPERIAAIGDVSTISVQYEWIDGTTVDISSPQNVHGVPGDVLSALTAFTAVPRPAEIAACAQRWRELKAKNAPFRVVSDTGLVSQPETYFDHIVLESASMSWQKTARIVGHALALCNDQCHQVGDQVLLSRVVALVESGALEAEGDPWLMRESRIRLACSG
jgi:hypothetical protein